MNRGKVQATRPETGHVQLSDYLDEHPKVIDLTVNDGGPAAFGLWTLALAWLSRNRRTDRDIQVPAEWPEQQLPGVGSRAAEHLVTAGLWRRTGDGWAFDDLEGAFRLAPIGLSRPKIPGSLRELVYGRDGYRCVTCGSAEDLSLDHIVPWSLGGADEEPNLQTMCRPCNSRKGARV